MLPKHFFNLKQSAYEGAMFLGAISSVPSFSTQNWILVYFSSL
jgi:ABC-type arginine/histidine transport system permease subunit